MNTNKVPFTEGDHVTLFCPDEDLTTRAYRLHFDNTLSNTSGRNLYESTFTPKQREQGVNTPWADLPKSRREYYIETRERLDALEN